MSQLSATEDEGVEVRGVSIDVSKHGVYALRIVNNKKKEVAVIGPQDIAFDATTQSFVATFPGPLEDVFYSEKYLELYMRIKPESIPYGQPSRERINVSQGLQMVMRVPMEFIPDPRTIIEDAHD